MTLGPKEPPASAEDVEAVRTAALDYIEGYVQGDAERHARAYHPECVKRRFVVDEETGIDELSVLSPRVMTDYAAVVGADFADSEFEIIIDDIYDDIASVRVYSSRWVDFLHVVKARGQWKLFHATWSSRPER